MQILKSAAGLTLDVVVVGILFISSALWAWESQIHGSIQHLVAHNVVIQHSFTDTGFLVLMVLNYLVYDRLYAIALIIAGVMLFGTPYYYLVLALASCNFGIDFGINVWMRLQRSAPTSST